MKKLFTLLFALGAVATVSAQTRDEAKDIILGKKKETTTEQNKKTETERPGGIILGRKKDEVEQPLPTGTENSSERAARIDQVNREYDAKIASIRNNPTLSEEEKNRAIAQLNKDRARKIREINNSDKVRSEDRDDDDNKGKKAKKSKGNNGNHYGWEKGKGNPHKNGGKPGKKGKS